MFIELGCGERRNLNMPSANTGNTQGGKRLLSIKEVHKEFGVTVWFWRMRIIEGDIPYVKTGKKHLVDRDDIEEFIKRNKTSEIVVGKTST
jgi:excisionase family DNA binding protein